MHGVMFNLSYCGKLFFFFFLLESVSHSSIALGRVSVE